MALNKVNVLSYKLDTSFFKQMSHELVTFKNKSCYCYTGQEEWDLGGVSWTM